MRLTQALFGAALALSTLASFARSDGEIYDPKGESAGAGFVDIALHIDAMDCDSWNVCTVSASGAFQRRPVAIDATIRARDGQGRITYRSVGVASDALAQTLATLYKLPRNDATFASTVTADIIFLDANAREMAGKVFFAANGPESDYAELYTNIDKQRRVLEIHEKDPEYRRNVLKALSH
jgi:hypothetical protein